MSANPRADISSWWVATYLWTSRRRPSGRAFTKSCYFSTRKTCCHTFRATGITASLGNGGTIENAQQIVNHESPKTTKLYDRTSDQIILDELERIVT